MKSCLRTILLLLSFFCLIPFLNVSDLYAEDTSTEEVVIDVENFKSIDFTSDEALLFVQSSSEASQTLLEYIDSVVPSETDIYKLYVVNVPEYGAVFTEFKSLYEDKCGIDNLYVPVMIYKDVCVYGTEEISFDIAVRFNLETENSSLEESMQENVDILNEAVEEYNAEIEAKTLLDWIKEINTSTLITLIGCMVLVIVSVILIVVFRKKIFKGTKILTSVFQIFLLVGSLGFLTYKVNDIQNDYAPLESLAGCIEDNNCATYAERVADGVASGSAYYIDKADQMRQDEELFGNNAAHIVAEAAAQNSAKMYTQILSMKEGEFIIIKDIMYKFDQSSGSLKYAYGDTAVNIRETILNSSNGIEENIAIIDKYGDPIKVTDKNGNITNKVISIESINTFLEANQGKAEVYSKQAKSNAMYNLQQNDICMRGEKYSSDCPCDQEDSDCKELDLIIDDLDEFRVKTKDCIMLDCPKLEKYYGLAVRYDAVTGTAVIVPTGKAIVDPCVENNTGNAVTGPILCNCGTVWTSAVTGTCDQICRVEKLICPTCNPATSEPEPIIPTTYTSSNPVPYCGDGILGNTTGEECEKGDPSGISCAWNTCSNTTCKCPEVTTPYCGDGEINNDSEECEVGNPTGYTCEWDNCNHTNCKCIEPGCGDGNIDEGELCEKGDPTGTSCLWDTECNQLKCTCTVEESESCGDGSLDENEVCEEGNPSGVECGWNECSKYTCTCPEEETTTTTTTTNTTTTSESVPQTSILDNSYFRNLTIGATLLALGFLFQPTVRFVDSFYIVTGNKVLKIGRYVLNKEKRETDKRRKNVEKGFK